MLGRTSGARAKGRAGVGGTGRAPVGAVAVAIAVLALTAPGRAQHDTGDDGPRNLDFEAGNAASGEPVGWEQPWAQPRSGRGFETTTDADVAHSGSGSGRIRAPEVSRGGFGTLTQAVPAAPYRGKRLRLAGFMRTDGVAGSAGLWMRVDGLRGMLAFDNMMDRGLSGTTGWQEHAVVHDVHPTAESIVFGALLSGAGTLWVDDLRLEVVGEEVPVTSTVVDEPAAPEPAPQAVVDEIARLAIPLVGVEAGSGLDDMEPLVALVGDARIVSLGEATHGSREFFQMKHRMLEFLVERMGFDVFAIEANWPESLAVNDYVLHGTGDPKAALAGMYFWTWNTEEVLALIEWMRAYNADASHGRKLRFFGYDMQIAQVAVARVADYLRRVEPDVAEAAAEAFELLSAGRESTYGQLPAEEMEATAAVLAAVARRFDAGREAWSAATSADEWSLARQHLVVAIQAERKLRLPAEAFALRDRSMAENIAWLLEREGPDTKIVSWAHNGHAMRCGYGDIASMGGNLDAMFGDDHVSLGFVFERGAFQAIDPAERRLREFVVGPPPDGAVGRVFARTGLDTFVLDLRAIPPGPLRDWIDAPRPMRSIGALFSDQDAHRYFNELTLPECFDALIFVRETTRARPVGGG